METIKEVLAVPLVLLALLLGAVVILILNLIPVSEVSQYDTPLPTDDQAW